MKVKLEVQLRGTVTVDLDDDVAQQLFRDLDAGCEVPLDEVPAVIDWMEVVNSAEPVVTEATPKVAASEETD